MSDAVDKQSEMRSKMQPLHLARWRTSATLKMAVEWRGGNKSTTRITLGENLGDDGEEMVETDHS